MLKKLLFALTAAIFLSLLALSSVSGEEQARGTSWLIYHDSGLDLTLAYPADWTLLPRTDAPDAIGQLITMTSPDSGNGFHCSIAVGQDLNEIGGENLLEWARTRLEIETETWGERPGEHLSPEFDLSIAGTSEAVHGDGAGYRHLLLRRGRLVWFVHANFGEADGPCNETLQSMVSALRLGPGSPDSLAGLVRLSRSGAVPGASILAPTRQIRVIGEKLSSSWYSPVNNDFNNKPWPVNCGSPLHTKGSSYAADIAASYGSPVYAAQAGTVFTVGDMSSGFGKYVVIKTNGYYHYYAHLSSIRSYIKKGYIVSRRGLMIGHVGNSGLGKPGTQGTHLHFHIQDGSSHTESKGLSLVGMTGFQSNEKYPSGSGLCGSMGR